jgi:hypothetical protein
MKQLIIILTLLPVLCLSQTQRSLSVTLQQDINNKAGLRFVQEEKGISFDAALCTDAQNIFATVKMGYQLLESGKSRLMVYPLYFDFKSGEGYRTPTQVSLLHSTPNLTYNIGVDLGLKGDWNVNASVSMPIMGKRYVPNAPCVGGYRIGKEKAAGFIVLICAGFLDGESENGTKSWVHEAVGALDFYHLADDGRKYGYVMGGMTVAHAGSRKNTKLTHWLADAAIVFISTRLAKRAGLEWVRN